mmetsp:Transcript_39649/g.55885  ORF Transcript_39649/g.55885 Transcript_39649/m.55885 type:complete len:515 (+) Transcript_39649:28-1572(+)|eukprot:CAMPEP_0202443738 /NCGR_PEP_ID=MMETSP1360-20130828/2915_1 /ASSEMBLY_ACC=CAM_ASM_000848 /TAXON_ID=515479 /ORGANISM="Licmophora paradoxa, Strain CCMP2313" /LENGTH=514 /DNA_ID=CAMNT_0049059495 /DNA_START=28 /DNA_END=1572 /DNA_ORIENTATION=+
MGNEQSALSVTRSKVMELVKDEETKTRKQKKRVTITDGKSRSDKSLKNAVVVTDVLSDVRVKYHINPKELGHGHYGVVRKCMDRKTNQWYAIKSIRKSKVGKIEVLKREIEILKRVDHPNIIKLVDIFEDQKYLHLITELCTGGELFDRIIDKTNSNEGHFSEHDAAKLVRDICDAIAYCHDVKQIAHRDLKPENFLFLNKKDDSPIKIIDFGLSRHDTQNLGIMKTKVGTPYYVAPEVLRRDYTHSCDIWSIGVITYILLCGYPPFYGDSDNEIFDSVRVGRFEFPSPEWDDISEEAKDFIRNMLHMDQKKRLTAAQAMKHKWIDSQLCGEEKSRRTSLTHHKNERTGPYIQFMSMNKLKKAALTNIANSLTTEEVGVLGDIFKKIDKDGDGMMTLSDLDEALAQEQFPQEIVENLKQLRESMSVEEGNTINWREFLALTMDKNLAMREDKIQSAFDHFKRSESNCLRLSDLVEVLGGETQANEIMTAVDSDGDGKISFDDFYRAIKDSFEER